MYPINQQRTRVLIIAGGGGFGIIPAYFVSGLGVSSLVGLISACGGTSVGSDLLSAFSAGLNPVKVYDKFIEVLPEIFKQSFWPTIRGAKYNSSVLKKFLEELQMPEKFGNLKIPIVIPVLDFKNNKFKVYDNIIKDEDCDLESYVPSLQSSSAPTYFVPYLGCIDGGIVENIPIMTTLSAINDKMGIAFKDMNVLVVGTGFKNYPPRDMKKVAKWYVWQWLKPMLNELTEANEKASIFWAGRLGLNYFNFFNPVELEKDWEMDRPQDYIKKLPDRCDRFVDDFRKTFQEFLSA